MIRVCILDGHEVVRRGVIDLLQQAGDADVVGASGSAAEATRLILTLRPDVAVLDARLPDGDGTDLLDAVRRVAAGQSLLGTRR